MNNQRRSFLRRAFGLVIAAPALSKIIANGGPAPKPAPEPPLPRIVPAPQFVTMSPQRAMTGGFHWETYEVFK